MFSVLGVIGAMVALEEQRAFEKSLPKEQRDELRRKREEALSHKRALELAEASRPKNFWGK